MCNISTVVAVAVVCVAMTQDVVGVGAIVVRLTIVRVRLRVRGVLIPPLLGSDGRSLTPALANQIIITVAAAIVETVVIPAR